MSTNLFKELTKEQEVEFRQWARDNFDPEIAINRCWHPVIRDEIEKIQAEKRKSNDLFFKYTGKRSQVSE